MANKKRIIAVLEDLFFTVKINEAAKRTGLEIIFVKSEKDALERAGEKADLMIVDLNCNCIEPLELIRKMKASPQLKPITLIGYLSHVQGELKQAAQDAGANIVLARSAFSQNIQQILKRHAGA
jgi:CheY-like chemotaxis protein